MKKSQSQRGGFSQSIGADFLQRTVVGTTYFAIISLKPSLSQNFPSRGHSCRGTRITFLFSSMMIVDAAKKAMSGNCKSFHRSFAKMGKDDVIIGEKGEKLCVDNRKHINGNCRAFRCFLRGKWSEHGGLFL